MPDRSPMQMEPAASGSPEPLAGSAGEGPAVADALPARRGFFTNLSRTEMWTYFGPAFVASVAYIDPGNFATNILGGTQFGYRLLWVLLWSNAMAMLIQYLAAKLGIVTASPCRRTAASTSPCHNHRPLDRRRDCGRRHRSRRIPGRGHPASTSSQSAALRPWLQPQGIAAGGRARLHRPGLRHPRASTSPASAGWSAASWPSSPLSGVSYAFEIFLVHPDWKLATLYTLLPTLDHSSSQNFHDSIYAAVPCWAQP